MPARALLALCLLVASASAFVLPVTPRPAAEVALRGRASSIVMGRGDKRTKKGKRFRHSFGNSRRRKPLQTAPAPSSAGGGEEPSTVPAEAEPARQRVKKAAPTVEEVRAAESAGSLGEDFTVEQMRDFLRGRGARGFSAMKKAELVAAVREAAAQLD